MSNNFSEITLALAGICQAIDCVQSIARNGSADKDDMNTLFKATLKLDAKSTEGIFDGHKNLHTGFKILKEQLSGSKTDADFGRYLVNVISLEKQFTANAKMLDLMGSRIQQTVRMSQYQDQVEVSSAIIQQLAETYKDTISRLSTKIQVTGNSKHLELSNNQETIRALLLGAIRCAVLWRQVGGKKRHFIFQKNAIVNTAKAFLA
ncbi:high frequency lysogenization protein HflD [Kangiella sp. TOML190]|uniref:high frequency lysogenization protein HflD n=1 Tax=Kangiella sp. TOML190 TaxID=2931351 RepID=UPI0020416089|nr:high frequency lysogenization protein HflD [Kangiella sp. TOML190]